MKVYLDSSVILRYVFQQPGVLAGWEQWETAFTSELCRVEGFRALDRVRLEGRMDDKTLAECLERIEKTLSRVEEVGLDRRILSRASQAFPTVLGALDAIHVASALLWRDENREELGFLTHDLRQGIGARAVGLQASGFES